MSGLISNRMFARDAVLCALLLEEAFSRAFLHFKDNHFNILLLLAILQASAMDVVLAELGVPRLLTSLKREEAGRRGDAAVSGWPRLADDQEAGSILDQYSESRREVDCHVWNWMTPDTTVE